MREWVRSHILPSGYRKTFYRLFWKIAGFRTVLGLLLLMTQCTSKTSREKRLEMVLLNTQLSWGLNFKSSFLWRWDYQSVIYNYEWFEIDFLLRMALSWFDLLRRSEYNLFMRCHQLKKEENTTWTALQHTWRIAKKNERWITSQAIIIVKQV